jgi:hypothetical protein
MGISRQELLYWKKMGVISTVKPDENEGKRNWLKVDFFEYCWIQLVIKLRSLNMPLDVISKFKKEIRDVDDQFIIEFLKDVNEFQKSKPLYQKVREELSFEEILDLMPPWLVSFYKKNFNPFNLLVLKVMLDQSAFALFVNYEGNFTFFENGNFENPELYIDFCEFINKPCLSIPLQDLLHDFYTNTHIKTKDRQTIFNLTEKEMKVLELLKKEGIKEIRIRLAKNNRGQILVETVEQKSIPATEATIKSLLKKGKYQNITLISEDGHLVLYEETNKTKI